jgi:hypothetical protein
MKTWLIALFMLPLFAASICAQSRAASLPAQMKRLLHLPQENAPLTPEVLRKTTDGDVELEDVRFRADQGGWVPAIIAKPVGATKPLPAIICLPGTSGTREHLTDAELKLSPFPRTGWARALAREGFVTISLDYRGSEARQQDIYLEAVREQLAGRAFMGLLGYEVMRAVDYLQTRADVDRTRIGVTGRRFLQEVK